MRHRSHPPRVLLNPVAVWELLDRLGISQNELARRCGFSPGHLSMLMNGQRSPSPRIRRRLMEVLGVDDFDLLFITEPPIAARTRNTEVEAPGPETTDAPKRKKGSTDAKTTAQAAASGRHRTL